MEVKYFLTADYANQTPEGKLNVLGIFDRIYSNSFPTIHPFLYVVGQLSANAAERGRKFTIQIKLLNEDGIEILGLGLEGEFPQDHHDPVADFAFGIALANIVFEKPGDYQFSLLVDNDEKETHRLQVLTATSQ
jgi:hypothetical protein